MAFRETCLQFDVSKNSVEWHNKASKFLQEHNIPPNPVSHLIAYEYFSHRRPELNKRINERLRDDASLDVYFLRDLFEEFCINQQEGKSEAHISNLQNLLLKVLEGISLSGTEAEAYSRVLEQQKTALDSDLGTEDLKNIANNLLEATQEAISENEKMKEHLQSAEENTRQLQRQVAELKEETSKDPLTGLYNRKALNERLSELVDEVSKSEEPLTLCMFDIDHFKAFNDNFGHQVGDQVIQLVSKTLQDKSRSSDFPARYGGEEFTLILPGTKMDIAELIASRIHQAVSRLALVKRSTKERLPSVTISMGLASFREGDSGESILSRADQALYHAKQTGRNRIVTEAELAAA